MKLYYVMKRRYKTPIAYVNDALAMVGILEPGSMCIDLCVRHAASSGVADRM